MGIFLDWSRKYKALLAILIVMCGSWAVFLSRSGVLDLVWRQSFYMHMHRSDAVEFSMKHSFWPAWLQLPDRKIKAIEPIPDKPNTFRCEFVQSQSTCIVRIHKIQNADRSLIIWQFQYLNNNGKKSIWSQSIEFFSMNEITRISFSYAWDSGMIFEQARFDKIKKFIASNRMTIQRFKKICNTRYRVHSIENNPK